MATARPSMMPSTGVMLFSGTNAVAPVMPRAPIPTPTTALISGMPAATMEPKAMSKMMKAANRPTTSLIGSMTIGSPKPGPPASACSPASRAMSRASLTTSLSASSTSAGRSTSKEKDAVPICPSGLRVATLAASASATSRGRPMSVEVEMISSDCCRLDSTGLSRASGSAMSPTLSRISASTRSTTSTFCGSSRDSPSGALNARVTSAASAGLSVPGNSSMSISVASCEGTPSMAKMSL